MSGEAPVRLSRRPLWGRALARLLCGVFALLGVLPLGLALLVRSEPVRTWVASETARVLREELGVEATYRVHLRVWPLEAAIEDLVVPGNDGAGPALTARRVAVRPRIMSLLSGRLDAGAVELSSPELRLVLRSGRLSNVAYRLPERKTQSRPLGYAPFASVTTHVGSLNTSPATSCDQPSAQTCAPASGSFVALSVTVPAIDARGSFRGSSRFGVTPAAVPPVAPLVCAAGEPCFARSRVEQRQNTRPATTAARTTTTKARFICAETYRA